MEGVGTCRTLGFASRACGPLSELSLDSDHWGALPGSAWSIFELWFSSVQLLEAEAGATLLKYTEIMRNTNLRFCCNSQGAHDPRSSFLT